MMTSCVNDKVEDKQLPDCICVEDVCDRGMEPWNGTAPWVNVDCCWHGPGSKTTDCHSLIRFGLD